MASKTLHSKYIDPNKQRQNLIGLEKIPMAQFAEQAYLNYSMYVILDRALPALSDGMKPVQRRIVYAMAELGLRATAKFKKSARTIGDVLGKFHPHGDSACYEAMVLMAQQFSYRYPLIDGQGNWGSQDDPKSFAAMRYTEARLTHYAQMMLEEINQGTVDWNANFDGTLNEPTNLPARLPNVLLNGASGIAVGMATDIPPHNLREVTSACIRLLENPTATLTDLCEHIKGPDFPTEGEIISTPQDIYQIYQTGHGSIRQRATWRKEDSDIIIHALPYQVSGDKVCEQIAVQMLAKKLPMVVGLRDESDQDNPTRLVIELRSNRVDTDTLMQHLLATTDLEKSYRVNFNIIGLDNRPQVYSLKPLLEQWIEFRLTTVKRRLSHRLDKINKRLHILTGLLIAYLNIDAVIHIIRNEDHPLQILIDTFELSEIQAEAILEIKLRQLAKLEQTKIQHESEELEQEHQKLEALLKSRSKLKNLIRDELIADAEAFGDARRSPIKQRKAARAMEHSDLVPSEPITVILSHKGWIRAAKGHDIDITKLTFKAGDKLLSAVRGKTNDLLIVLDSSGRTYSLPAHSLPSVRSAGEPLSSNLNPGPSTYFCGLMIGSENTEYLLSNDRGYGFVAKLSDLHTRNKAGKSCFKIPDNGSILIPQRIFEYEDDWIAVITNVGRMLIFTVGEITRLSKGKGIKLINIPTEKYELGEEKLIDIVIFREGESLKITSGKRYLKLKPKDFDNYVGNRAHRGRFLTKGFRHVKWIEVLIK